MSEESFIQVAPDSTGKKMRTVVDSIRQPDQTFADVHTEIVQEKPEFTESQREAYMRKLAENTLLALNQIVILLAATSGRQSTYGRDIV